MAAQDSRSAYGLLYFGSSDTAAVPDGWYLGTLGLIITSGPTSLVQARVTAYHLVRVIGPLGGIMALELVPLCTLHFQLKPPIVVGAGCAGRRVIVEVASVEVTGDRLRGEMVGAAAADWLLIGPEGTATPDIRAALRTDDGAIIFMQYNGKIAGDWSQGPQLPATVYVAPRFETCDERYLWLNRIQAIGKGTLQEDGLSLDYDWYEVR